MAGMACWGMRGPASPCRKPLEDSTLCHTLGKLFLTTLLLFLRVLEEKTISRKDAFDDLEVLPFPNTACLASS